MISIIVCTYNSDWDKTRQTLYSIISQKNVDFEVIVADDGSKGNNFGKIEKYFQKNDFNKYTLVGNKENRGTIKNILSALEKAKGQWVKPISPGDFFYNSDALYYYYDFVTKNEASVYFGTAIYYSKDDDGIHLHLNENNPRDLRPYLRRDGSTIRENYIYLHDFILGASFIYETKNWLFYLRKIESLLKYAEDLSVILMVADNQVIRYIPFINDNFFMWYENSSGISRVASDKWKRIIFDEVKLTYHKLLKERIIRNYFYNFAFEKNRSKILKFILFFLISPRLAVRRFFWSRSKSIAGYELRNVESKELENILSY